MEHISTQLEKIKPGEKNQTETIKCARCKSEVQFSENQYRKYCPKCGISISRPMTEKGKPKAQSKRDCFICNDNGIITYHAQVGSCIYEFVARCACPKGNMMGDAIPRLSQCKMAPTTEYIEYLNKG